MTKFKDLLQLVCPANKSDGRTAPHTATMDSSTEMRGQRRYENGIAHYFRSLILPYITPFSTGGGNRWCYQIKSILFLQQVSHNSYTNIPFV